MPVVNNKHVKWDSRKHSPSERCEATISNGQCINCKVAGSNFCLNHGANKSTNIQNEERVRNLRLLHWRQRVGELADSDDIKSLREEVGILRLLLENMLNQCKDSQDLLLFSHRLSDLVLKIERLVVSCDKLENKMGLLLNKDSVLQLAATYVTIINNHISDPSTIEEISNEMLEATKQIGQLTQEV